MNLPLELERIEVDTPPASPVSFADDSFDSIDTAEVVSPVKRVRASGGSREPKKRQRNDRTATEPRVDEFVQNTSSDEFYPLEQALVGGYASYVVEVGDQVAGFFPLSSDLFVVQGWDEKLSCTKVSLDFIEGETKLTKP